MPDFSAEQISGPTWIPNTTRYYFDVDLGDGKVGHAIVASPMQAQASAEAIAASLNFLVAGSTDAEVVEALMSAGGLAVEPAA